MKLSVVLAIVGTLCGIYYWYLGIIAGGYMLDETKRKSPSERLLSAGLAWSVVSGDEYSEEGKKLCKRADIVLILAILCWIGWGILK